MSVLAGGPGPCSGKSSNSIHPSRCRTAGPWTRPLTCCQGRRRVGGFFSAISAQPHTVLCVHTSLRFLEGYSFGLGKAYWLLIL
jgi:hypothetical protein